MKCTELTRCGYEVPGMIFIASLLRGVTFKVLLLSSYVLSPTMLPLLETFLGFLL